MSFINECKRVDVCPTTKYVVKKEKKTFFINQLQTKIPANMIQILKKHASTWQNGKEGSLREKGKEWSGTTRPGRTPACNAICSG